MRDEETKTLTVELTGAQLSGAGVLNAIAEITGTDRDLLGKMGIRLTWERGRPVRELSVPLRAENGELGWHTEQVNVGEDGHVQIGEHVATPRHARAVNRVFQQADYHAPLRRSNGSMGKREKPARPLPRQACGDELGMGTL